MYTAYDQNINESLQEVLSIVPLPHKPTQIGVIGSEKGCIIDIKTKRNVRSIPKWNGSCTQDGKFGLYAPSRGGLELLELRKGSTGTFNELFIYIFICLEEETTEQLSVQLSFAFSLVY